MCNVFFFPGVCIVFLHMNIPGKGVRSVFVALRIDETHGPDWPLTTTQSVCVTAGTDYKYCNTPPQGRSTETSLTPPMFVMLQGQSFLSYNRISGVVLGADGGLIITRKATPSALPAEMLLLLPILPAALFTKAAVQLEPNPPVWPSSVSIFGPTDKGIEGKIHEAYNENGGHTPANHGQFSSSRFAFLFKPGVYDVDCPVGYYTQVLGLGTSPGDVTFTSPKGVYSEEQDYSVGGALSTFWRSAENFRSSAYENWQVGKGMMWAVSQAAPLRRVEVDNDLMLFEYQPPIPAAGEASGGFMANIKVGAAIKAGAAGSSIAQPDGVSPGSQQQWFARDSSVDSWAGGVWNMVFSGVEGAPASHCGKSTTAGSTTGPFTTVSHTPTIAEKPYITIDVDGKYALQVPPLKTDSRGASFDTAGTKTIGFEHVYVTSPADSAAKSTVTRCASKRHRLRFPVR